MTEYPDDVTYDIVQYASEILDMSDESLLIRLGKRWIEVTTKGEYRDYYHLGGHDFFTFQPI